MRRGIPLYDYRYPLFGSSKGATSDASEDLQTGRRRRRRRRPRHRHPQPDRAVRHDGAGGGRWLTALHSTRARECRRCRRTRSGPVLRAERGHRGCQCAGQPIHSGQPKRCRGRIWVPSLFPELRLACWPRNGPRDHRTGRCSSPPSWVSTRIPRLSPRRPPRGVEQAIGENVAPMMLSANRLNRPIATSHRQIRMRAVERICTFWWNNSSEQRTVASPALANAEWGTLDLLNWDIMPPVNCNNSTAATVRGVDAGRVRPSAFRSTPTSTERSQVIHTRMFAEGRVTLRRRTGDGSSGMPGTWESRCTSP